MLLRNKYFEIIDEIDIYDENKQLLKGLLKKIEINNDLNEIDEDEIIEIIEIFDIYEINYLFDDEKIIEITIEDLIKQYFKENNIVDFYLNNKYEIDEDNEILNFFDIVDFLNMKLKENENYTLYNIIDNLNYNFFDEIKNKDDLYENYFYFTNEKINFIKKDEIKDLIDEDEIIKTIVENDLIKELI